MGLASPARWWATIRFGQVPMAVACAGEGPDGWPEGAQARLVACADGPREGPPAAESVLLVPLRGQERAYRVLAAALAADDLVGLLELDGVPGTRLRSLGEALVVERGCAASLEEARGFAEGELGLTLALLRSLPRCLPTRGAGGPDGAPAPVIDLQAIRAARAARG
jgi:hypothetical protein